MAYDFKQEQRQGLKLSQQLIMTPQLQLAIRLLQLSRLELLDTVREELQSNPVLEDSVVSDTVDVPEPEPEPEPTTPSQELDWQSYLEDYDNYKPPVRSVVDRHEDNLVERVSPSGGSLKEYLMWQLNNSMLSEYEKKIGEFVIGNIDEDGCLRIIERVSVEDEDSVYEDAVIDDIARLTGAAGEEVLSVLDVIQQFDPPGVGARDVSECLLLQARRLGVRDTVVEEIILRHLERLANKNYKAIAREMDLPLDKVYEAVKIITGNLNPVPGAGFGLDESRVIVPDVYIQKVGGEYVFTLNEDGMPKLKVSRYYRKMLKENGASSEAGGYIQERLRSALWFIKSVHQRQKTLLRVVGSIVTFQEEFLDKGLKYMKPLVLKDVAEDIGVHESTVSRVTSNKYAQTPRGVFELKYFFSSGMNGSDGSTITAEYIKERVKSIIESEDLKKPFSDQQIADKLKEFGIAVARRTATKYREDIGYLSSSRRKTHF